MGYSQEFWNNVEIDRNNGMSVQAVCQKYFILPSTLQRARRAGKINDKVKLTPKEAVTQRTRVESLGPTYVAMRYVELGCSIKQLMVELKLSNSKANRQCVVNLIEAADISIKQSPVGKSSITKQLIIDACKQANSMSELSRMLGLTIHSSNFKTLRTLIQKYEIDTSCWVNNKSKYKHSDIFCVNSSLARTQLRHHILKHNAIDLSKCSICGVNEWQGNPLKIQVDHINGDSTDNRIENLRGLCPNCHSQTVTFCGNKKRKQ